MTRKQRHSFYGNCPVEAALDIIGGKWKAILIFHILDGPKRFGEFGRLLPGLTQRMLTTQLRELEADGVILRTVYAQVPPKVEYSIADFGRTLAPLLRELAAWSEVHVKPRLKVPNETTSAALVEAVEIRKERRARLAAREMPFAGPKKK